MSTLTLLFADNDPDFLDTRAEFLADAGYQVLKAYTLKQAEQLLVDTHIHLAIVDIRLVDDDDERDTSGLTLVKDAAYRSLPKIVLTGFPTYQAVREAMGLALDGLPPAVDFLSKQEGPEAMIQAIERVFAAHVRINWDLHVHWDEREHLSFLHLAGLVQPDLPNGALVQRAVELEDLIRRLFYDYRQIRIGRLFWHDGGRFCLSVLAQSPQGAIDPRILVCGERGQLELELKQMQELAPETARGTKLMGKTETVHFGAAVYVLPDANLETVQPLRELFHSGRERPLKAAFEHLLQEVLAAWHRRGQGLEESHDLMALYRLRVGLAGGGLSRAEVERRIEALVRAIPSPSRVEIERRAGSVTFHSPNQTPLICPDPVATAYASFEQYSSSVVCKVSPGQLTADNVLVDAERQTWLTDFAGASQTPQWWDFVCLEGMIRFDLSQAPDILSWQEFEECLVAPISLHDRLPAEEVLADLRTNIVLIEQIRRQASKEAGADPQPYYAGLLVWSVGAMACYDPTVLHTQDEHMRGAHLFLAAAMLASRLGKTPPRVPASGVLRLNGEGSAWIGEHRIGMLTGQELDLFRCLYEHRGKLVSRKNIVEVVFREQYQPGDAQMESRINSLTRRLRVRIEPNPDRPRYLFTVRGDGYRLQVGEESDE